MEKQKNILLLLLSTVLLFITKPVQASNFAESLSTSYIFLGIILFLGFVGLVMSIFTSNIGLGSLISVFAFSAFFILNRPGLDGKSYISYFIIGLILLVIEIIVPGFTLTGIAGIVLISLSIIQTVPNLAYGIVMLVLVMISTIFLIVYMFKKGYTNGFIDKLILKETHMDNVDLEGKEETSLKLIGKEGRVVTDMRPSGTITINGEYLDAISEGTYIKKGESIKIIKVEGNKITVRRV